MCGLVGIFNGTVESISKLEEANDLLRHRGPDGKGSFVSNKCVLKHRRLSIVDVSGGAQPLYSENKRIALVYNGEIYNHNALQALFKNVHKPATVSDGEVIIHLYEDFGAEQAVAMLRGMFALALWDGKRLVLARDPLGIKPLYWSRSPAGLCFGSEIKALLPLCNPATIEVFPPGYVFTSDGGLKRFCSLKVASDAMPQLSQDPDEAEQQLFNQLDESVSLRLMADVPVGVFLSGGLDSSLIAAMMAKRIKNLHSFAVGTPGSPDLERAAFVARLLKTQHHETYLDLKEVDDALETIIYYLESFDPDLVQSAVPCYFVSKEAARHVKVVLTGEGADELFAGYRYYRQYDLTTLDKELWRSIDNLHHINLQRADRMSMAHGLEARVPFLDVNFVSQSMRVPPSAKLTPAHDKNILRKVAERLLPAEIAWREKEQFDEGSGSSALLAKLTKRGVSAPQSRYRELFEKSIPWSVHRIVAQWSANRLAP